MSYAPASLLDARSYLLEKTGLSPNEVGIVGDSKHRGGYHCGRDRLVANDYSHRTARDKAGLTDGASALDIGNFARMRELGPWLVARCQASAPGTDQIREIIYTDNGSRVLRYDRERGATSAPREEGDDSHRWHIHVSFYRDTEATPKAGLFKAFFEGIPAPQPPAAPAWPGRHLKYTKGRSMLRGEDVRRWQQRMRDRSWNIDVDGEYGPQSSGVALKFQREKGLTVDGIVGPQTWAASWTLPIT